MINITRVYLMVLPAMMAFNQAHSEQEIHITKLKPNYSPHKLSMQEQSNFGLRLQTQSIRQLSFSRSSPTRPKTSF
jgi:hypothetical protein